MGARKPISKKIRFEVFKRDKFTCQYCGRSAPDVILEIDHLNPVINGGDNDILNLVTSCRDCNRGKGKHKLSDNAIIEKQRTQLKELSEKREQLEMVLEWREELKNISEKEIMAFCGEFEEHTGFGLSNDQKLKLKQLFNEFQFNDVMDAMDIAIEKYFDGTRRGASISFYKIGGICYNRKNQSSKEYQFNYLRKCCYNNFQECNEDILHKIVDNIESVGDFVWIVDDLKNRKTWNDFVFVNYEPDEDV